ncbi:MAG: T9SS type A sorting domain-containing protein [Bacteroidales bacterium]|nr:T9SS type A sorting domain-containing protein [Bacteroidales bacterium]
MKNLILIFLLLSGLVSFSQKITRGPDIGEIYFLGPTHTGEGLYYSIDFGETAVCVDSIKNIITIAADKAQGGIFCFEMPHNLYYSTDYGNSGSWIFKNGALELSEDIESGINSGHIFSNFYMHSEDYGSNFTFHSCNGYFGNVKNFDIDNIDDNIGYVISVKLTNADTSYLFITFDKFENVDVKQKFYFPNGQNIYLSRGNETGELFLYFRNYGILNFSQDYAENIYIIDKFNFVNFYGFDIIGGKQPGEVYFLYNFINMMWQNAHTYIYHSTDYGVTFEVFHPFSKGIEPLLANFSTLTQEGTLPLTVEFCNFSIGDITKYEWDFNNDGTVDSYEESPAWIYADTGWYSVKLTIYDEYDTNSFVKENYIFVYDSVGTNISKQTKPEIVNCYPNPFKEITNIKFLIPHKVNVVIKVYNVLGKEITSKALGILDKGTHNTEFSGINLKTGIYYYSLLVNGETAGVRKMVKVE